MGAPSSKAESLRCGLGVNTETGFLSVTLIYTLVWNWEVFSVPLYSFSSSLPSLYTTVPFSSVWDPGPSVLAMEVKEMLGLQPLRIYLQAPKRFWKLDRCSHVFCCSRS